MDMDLIELKNKISRAKNYKKLIEILGKTGSLAHKQIIEQGINGNSLNPLLKIALGDGVIEKIGKKSSRYRLIHLHTLEQSINLRKLF